MYILKLTEEQVQTACEALRGCDYSSFEEFEEADKLRLAIAAEVACQQCGTGADK